MKRDFILKMLLVSLLVFFLCGCGPSQASPVNKPTKSIFPTSPTVPTKPASPRPILSPSRTPSTSPTEPPKIIAGEFEIPECIDNGTGDGKTFDDLLSSLAPSLNEMESYRYHTIYHYQVDGEYLEDALAVEVFGAHSSRLPVEAEQPEDEPFILASDLYEQSQVKLTNLRTGYQEEVILDGEGIWVRFDDDPKWIELTEAGKGNLLNLPDIFSPQSTVWVVAQPYMNAGIFVPSTSAGPPLMSQSEEIDGQKVKHRCWVTSEEEGYWGQAIAHPGIFTRLVEAEFHLWTAEDDSKFIRLAITGDHWGECPNHCDGVIYQHDNLRKLFLWMELSDVGAPVEIQTPGDDQIGIKIPSKGLELTGEKSTPINDLPLPTDASPAPTLENLQTDPRKYPYEEPREYIQATNRFNYKMMADYVSSSWTDPPADRSPTYLTEKGMVETASFYLDEMSRRGWELKGRSVQLGIPKLFLLFEQEEIIFMISLSPGEKGGTSISAVLPPSKEVMEAIKEGWSEYTPENSGLSGEFVHDLALDQEGGAWITSDGGVDRFDGSNWSHHEGVSLFWGSPIEVDEAGNILVGTSTDVTMFDGQTWTSIDLIQGIRSVRDIYIDSPNKYWVSIEGDVPYGNGLGLIEGSNFTYFTNEDIGFHSSHIVTDLVRDPRGEVWVSTDGGGLFVFDGDDWRTEQPPDCPPNYTGCYDNDLIIDQQGWLWISEPEGLRVFNGREWGVYTSDSGLPFPNFTRIAVDNQNRLWAASNEGGLSVLETDGSWLTYTPEGAYRFFYALDTLEVGPDGRIWLAGIGKVMVFDPPDPSSTQIRDFPTPGLQPPISTILPEPESGWNRYTIENSELPSNMITSLVIDDDDRVWIGTDSGLTSISSDGSQATYVNTNSPLLNDYISTLTLDDRDRLWIGTGHGLARLDPDGAWMLFPPDEGLCYPLEEVPEGARMLYPNIDAVLVDGEERVWMGNNANGTGQAISVMDMEDNWHIYIPENSGLPDNHVYTLALDDQGQVWAGTWDGISVLGTDDRWETTSLFDLGIAGEYEIVTDIVFDDSGRLLIGTTAGLVVRDPDGSLTQYTSNDSELINDYIRALYIDDQGRIWIGTAGGLSILETDGAWTNYPSGNALLPLGGITDLAIDSQGRVWAGTTWGVSILVP